MRERLKEVRKTLGLTQQQFADRLGVKRTLIAASEVRGATIPDTTISLIVKTFHVSETWLRTGDGEMFVPADDPILALAAEYGLNPREASLIRTFAGLDADARAAVLSFVEKAAEALAEAAKEQDIDRQIEAEAEAEAQEYKRQRILEKKAEAGLLDSSPPDVDVKRA